MPTGTSFEEILEGTGNVLPGTYGYAIDDLIDADYPIWSAQVQMIYPLGRSVDEAAYEQARLELRQKEPQLEWIELQVATEATNAALQVVDAFQESILAATAARELAEQQLHAEEIED